MTAPVIITMPGASLMQFDVLENGRVQVTCPGCHEVWMFAADAPGSVLSAAFHHRNGCAVHARIQAAVAEYEDAVVRRG